MIRARSNSPLIPSADAAVAAGSALQLGAWGDSLTYGFAPGEVLGPYIPYMQQMANWAPFRPFYNEGISGQNSTQIADRFVAAPEYWGMTTILWMGRNDIADFGTGWVTTTIANIQRCVDELESVGNSRYIIWGVTTGGNEYTGGASEAIYDEIVAANALIAAEFGTKFFDMRAWMASTSPFTALGLTPDATDLMQMARNQIPTRWLRDATDIHFNNDGTNAQGYIATQHVAAMDAATSDQLMTVYGASELDGTGVTAAFEYLRAYRGIQMGDPVQGLGLGVQWDAQKFIFMAGGGQEIPDNIYGNALTSEWSFFGYGAGGTTFIGRGGTGVGAYALNSLTTGVFNTAIGVSAGRGLTTSESNVAVGVDALRTLSTQSDGSVAVGRYSLYNYIGTSPSTAVGFSALFQATTGSKNTALGNLALGGTTTGSQNVGVGDNALHANTTGSNNIAIGGNALDASVAVDNLIAIGVNSQTALTTGTGNVSVGTSSMAALNSSRNTAVGHQTLLVSTDTSGGNTAIGHQVLVANTSGAANTGVGRDALLANTTGNSSVALGAFALSLATTGGRNIGVGYQAGDNITTATGCVVIGTSVDAWSATINNQLVISNIIYATAIDGTGTTPSAGNVGIGGVPDGTGASSAKLDVYGDKIRIRTSKTPSSATDVGVTGDVCWDSGYIYVATATNTWKRAAIATW